jgi:hypothetical protein
MIKGLVVALDPAMARPPAKVTKGRRRGLEGPRAEDSKAARCLCREEFPKGGLITLEE